MSTLHGVACPAWELGAVVAPGPSWRRSDFGPQNQQVVDGCKVYTFGRVNIPDGDTISTWADYVVHAVVQGDIDPFGGWAPHRSVQVTWAGDSAAKDRTYNYKAGDEGDFDLQYWPELGFKSSEHDIQFFLGLAKQFFECAVQGMQRALSVQSSAEGKQSLSKRFRQYFEEEQFRLQEALTMMMRVGKKGFGGVVSMEVDDPCVHLHRAPGLDMVVREDDGDGHLLKSMQMISDDFNSWRSYSAGLSQIVSGARIMRDV